MEDLTDATLYVSLEPCCHEGKTPPCTDAILQAGIRRVVVASDDPTEKASGRGLGILRDEGVEVMLANGDLAASARMRRGAVAEAPDAAKSGANMVLELARKGVNALPAATLRAHAAIFASGWG